MPWSTLRSQLHVEKIALLVRDSDMSINRLSKLPEVKPCTIVNDDNEQYAKNSGYYIEDSEEGVVQIFEVPLGTKFFGKTEAGLIRLASQLRGRPISEAIVVNIELVCRYWKPPDIASVSRFIDDWSDWRSVKHAGPKMHVRCSLHLEGEFPRLCMNFRSRGSDKIVVVDIRTTGRCAVYGLELEAGEDLLELANEILVKMERA